MPPAVSPGPALCAKPAKLLLTIVGDGTATTPAAVGTYCVDHFHKERGLLISQGRRTGVSILDDPKPIACLGRD